MQKEKKDKHFIKKPIYPGGSSAMRSFINENLKYPKDALNNKIEGTVYLRYEINYNGDVTDVKVLGGIGYGCDEEAIRVVRLLKFKVPKGPRKLKVTFHKSTRIHFKLSKKQDESIQESTGQAQIQYVVTSTKKEDKLKTGNTYTYTINIS